LNNIRVRVFPDLLIAHWFGLAGARLLEAAAAVATFAGSGALMTWIFTHVW
jgi:hypothetical protein